MKFKRRMGGESGRQAENAYKKSVESRWARWIRHKNGIVEIGLGNCCRLSSYN